MSEKYNGIERLNLKFENDWILNTLVGWVNTIETELKIIVHCNGFLISGLLISARNWCSLQSEIQTEPMFKEFFQNLSDDYYNEHTVSKTSIDVEYAVYHMKDAQFYDGSQNPLPSTSCLWRGKLSEVSGFTLGQFNSEKA